MMLFLHLLHRYMIYACIISTTQYIYFISTNLSILYSTAKNKNYHYSLRVFPILLCYKWKIVRMVHGPYKLSSNNTNSFISDISCSHYSRVSCLPRGRIICKAGYYQTSHNGVSADTKMVAEDGIPAI